MKYTPVFTTMRQRIWDRETVLPELTRSIAFYLTQRLEQVAQYDEHRDSKNQAHIYGTARRLKKNQGEKEKLESELAVEFNKTRWAIEAKIEKSKEAVLGDLHHSEETRSVLRSMPVAERLKAVADGIKNGNAEMIGAIYDKPLFLTGIPKEQNQALQDFAADSFQAPWLAMHHELSDLRKIIDKLEAGLTSDENQFLTENAQTINFVNKVVTDLKED